MMTIKTIFLTFLMVGSFLFFGLIHYPLQIPNGKISSFNLYQTIGERVSSTQENSLHLVLWDTEEQFQMISQMSPQKFYPNLKGALLNLSFSEKKSLISHGFPYAIPISSLYLKTLKPSVKKMDVNMSDLGNSRQADFHGVTPLWQMGYNGTGIVVGQVDTGVDFNHPALAGKMFAYNYFNPPGIPGDKFHGTLTAGTIVSSGEGYDNRSEALGLAFGAKLAVAEVGIDTFVFGDFIGALDWLMGLEEVKVINYSLGSLLNHLNPVIERIEAANKVFVAAAGNNGEGGENRVEAFNFLGPASSIHAIGVGGADYDGTLFDKSSEGPGDNGIMKPDLVALGSEILTTIPDGYFAVYGGTSLSTSLVSGAIATLISALEDQGINWTVATIKAAIMRTAVDLGLSEYQQGKGLINVTAAYEYLLGLPRDQYNRPIIFELTPRKGLFPQMTNAAAGEKLLLPLTLITSQIDDISYSIQGNLSSFTRIVPPSTGNLSSNYLWLNITPSVSQQPGLYLANLSVSLLNDTITVPLKVNLYPPPIKRVYLDAYYTVYEDLFMFGPAGEFTGGLNPLLIPQGYWFDVVNAPFSLAKLEQYDLVVLIGPLENYELSRSTATPISPSELNALVSYLEGGGSMFLFYDVLSPNTYIQHPDTITQLFGVHIPILGLDPDNYTVVTVDLHGNNETSVARHVERIDVTNGPIEIKAPAFPIAIDENENVYVAASTTNNHLGRIVITGSPYPFFSTYFDWPGGLPNARDFMVDLFEYLTSSARIIMVNDTSTMDKIEWTVRATVNGTPSPTPPVFQMRNFPNDLIQPTITDLGEGYYRVRWNIQTDFKYQPEAVLMNDYLSKTFIRDTTPPVLTSDNRNPTNISVERDIVALNFYVQDNNTIEWGTLNVQIDGSNEGFSILASPPRILVTFNPKNLNSTIPVHELRISINDSFGNEGRFSFSFTVFGSVSSVTSIVSSSTSDDFETYNSSDSQSPFPQSMLILLPLTPIFRTILIKKKGSKKINCV